MEAIEKEEFRVPKRLRGMQKSNIRQIFDSALPGSVNFGLGQPDLPTPECIREEAVRVIREENNGYTSHAGLPALREKVVADYPHLGLTPDDCIITVGSNEALYCATMALCEEGDEVLVPNPAFPAYPAINRLAGAETVLYRMPREKGFGFDAGEFEKQINEKTRAAIILSPSNPTGRTLSREDLRSIAGILEGTGIYAISDEIYKELYFTKEKPGSISEYYDKTLVVGGLSKNMSMTGWRMGWVLGVPEVIKRALVVHGYNTVCTSTVTQKASLAYWTGEGKRAETECREIWRRRKDLLISLIESELGLKAFAPEGAFYTMMDVSELGPEMDIVNRFLENRVITVNGSGFGDEAKGFLRISFCASESDIREGVKRMKEAIESI
ncbi:MAG: pyridoxal phosphate-dependent aminotransferase [Acidobacteriota bacterium]|nr:pyridoxal phosphate-dependent aminotransferase [Acidobacteriota bacterium]MDH3528923.1 pyridoxal phosphate-dependent aminotransferase [Acidobacteriota bacterium]